MNAMNRFALSQGYNVEVKDDTPHQYAGAPFSVNKENERPSIQDINFVQLISPGCVATTPLMVPKELEFTNEDYIMLNRMNTFIDQYYNTNAFSLANPTAYLSGFSDCRNFMVHVKAPEGFNIPNIAFQMINGIISVAVGL